jgi:TatD DNase family protein
MKLIDTHAHLYLEEFKNDIEGVIDNAIKQGVEKIYLPGIDSSEIANMLALEDKYPDSCVPMMGLHPCYVKENYRDELAIVADWLAKRRFAAVGEIGLDFYWDTSFSQQQYEAFAIQMQWAIDRDYPIVIHTRNAMEETISAVKPFVEKGLRGIFHCFSGNADAAKRVTDMGFYLGIGGVITYKNSGLAEALENIPVEKLVLETDAPYLTPVPYRGKRNESAYLRYILSKLSEVKKMPELELAAITTANAQKIFGS